MNFSIFFIVIEYVVVTYVFGLIFKVIGWKSSTYIQRNFGWTGYCVLGSVGVTYHELSHLITAVLFRHNIKEIQLFRPFQGKTDGTLGYVNHSWNNKSLYQRIGNFFIGTAPMFFGAGLLFLVLNIAYPSSFPAVVEITEIFGALGFSFREMFVLDNLLTIWTPIIFMLTIIVCPYMHMSWADVKGATSGAITLLITSFILSLISIAVPSDMMAQIQSAMNTFVTYYIYMLIISLIMNVIILFCLVIVSVIRGKRF